MDDIAPYLKMMASKEASDLFFCTGIAPHIKVNGVICPVGNQKLLPGKVAEIADSLMTEDQAKEFSEVMEMNFAIPMKNVGRFRVNIFRQRGEISVVIRYIKPDIPKFMEMNLPPVLGDIVMEKRGLVLAVGATGSGKSTTLAAMIGHRNQRHRSHILTVEDPVEFMHSHAKSIVQQREVGIDTLSYENALKNALRESPDVILIGEIRDMQTMKYAISYAETGHLCLATLHANNADQAMERILNFFPEVAHRQLLSDLSLNLKAVVSQRLLSSIDGKELIPAVEIMINSPLIADLIKKGEIGSIKDAMRDTVDDTMITFDQALITLYRAGKISLDEATKNADSKNDFSLTVRMDKKNDQHGASATDSNANELVLS